MENVTHAHPESKDICADKASKPEKVKKNNTRKRPLEIIEECARREGVSLSEQMWAQLEKAVDMNWEL